jgi:hypothetical protein
MPASRWLYDMTEREFSVRLDAQFSGWLGGSRATHFR